MRAALASLAVLAAALSPVVLSSAHAGEQLVDKKGRANFGYDVVAYHTQNAAVEGTDEFSAQYNDATFLFASAEHRDLFLANPERFAPAYDGHCAFAIISYKKLTVDPEAFVIADPETHLPVGTDYNPMTDDGILYLNYSEGVNKQFRELLPQGIVDADLAWDDCLENLPAGRARKGLRDFFGGGDRPDSCPPVAG